MKKLRGDDLVKGLAVTILSGPYEQDNRWPPGMMGDCEPHLINLAKPGRVYIVECVDMPLIMLRALDSAPKQQVPAGVPIQLMSLLGGAPQPQSNTYMFQFKDIELAAVSPEWLESYVKNFCEGSKNDGARGKIARTSRATLTSEVAHEERPACDSERTTRTGETPT